jgi:hypothetical protein
MRIQKDGEVTAHRHKTSGGQIFGPGTHHHPVLVARRHTQQGVTYRAAHYIDLQAFQNRIWRPH